MSRTTRSLTCVLWLTLMGIAAAQTSVDDPGMATIQNYSGGVTLGGTSFNIFHLSGDGVGYRNGYTQIGTLSPFWISEDAVIASNNRLMITDTQQIGGNIGGLLRYLDPTSERIFGVNGYWDLDQSVYDNHYQQVGIGVETLGEWWDFRANGYFALTDTKNFLGAYAIGNDLTYWRHQVGFLGVGQYENAQSGGDWEFGVPLTPVTPWLRGYAGMYYYDAKANTPVGFRGRIEGWVADDLQLGVQVTQDRQYGTNVNASVNFQFAGFRPTRWFPNFTSRDRMLNPVQRNWRVATGKYEQVDFVPAINPRTDLPYFIDWVDNSQLLAGNGTYETPFNYLPNSAPDADLILVRVGDTTSIAPLSGSITLQDWQRLLGEGREHEIQAYARYGNITTPVQTFNLPEFTNTGAYPYLTSNGDIVTLASHNEVSAFNLIDAAGFAIRNTPAGSVDFNTNYLNIRDNNGGIFLTNATGGGLVSNVNALNNAVGGINIDSGNAPLFLSFQDVTSNSIPAGNQLFGIAARADDGAIIAEFNNVTTNGNNTFGILLTESNTGMRATLNNVTASGNGVAGLRASGIGSELNLSLTNVNTSNNTGRGIWISGNGTNVVFNYNNLTDSGNGGDNINFTLSNGSVLTGGGLHDVNFDNSVNGSGIVFDLDGSQVGTLLDPFRIVNVTADGNGQNGMAIVAANGSFANFQIEDATFDGNLLDGISVTQFGGSTVGLFASPASVSNNGRDGFRFNVNDGSTLAAVFAAGDLSGNDRSAVFGEVDLIGTGGSTVNLLINDSTADNSGADGMRITSAAGAAVNVGVNNSSFSNSGQTVVGSSGVRLDAVDSTINLSLYNTLVENTAAFPAGTQAFGLQLNLNNTDFVGDVGLTSLSNNLRDGALVNLSNGSVGGLTMTDVTADGNGENGLKAVVETGSDLVISATNSSFSNNGQALGVEGSGLNLSVDGANSELTTFLRSVQLDGNNRHGLLGLATNGSFLGLSMLDNSTADGNTLDGLNVSAFDSQFIGEIDAASFSNNRSGLVYVGAGAGPDVSAISLSNVSADNNSVDGFRFNASGGHLLLLDALNSSFSNNGGTGILGNVSGAGTVVEINPFNYVLGNDNGNGGLDLHVFDQGFLNGNINGGSFTGNGTNGTFDGVRVAVDSAGQAVICFDGTAVNSNTGDGFDFSAVDAGSRIDVALQTSGQFGTLQANSNVGQGVRFLVGPGASGTLFMDGGIETIGNGSGTPITYVVNGAAQAAFTFSGTSDGNTGDGINIQMTNVADAYIDIYDGSVSNNTESGIDITLNNVVFGAAPLTVSFLQGDFTANPFRIENMDINQNGEEGIKIVGTDVIMPVGIIYNNSIQGNGTAGAFDGILLDISGNSILADLSIGNDLVAGSGNDINSNSRNGINVQLHDNSQIGLTIQGNNVIANSLNNIRVDLPDNTLAQLNIDNNNVDGDGVPAVPQFEVGLNFTANTFSSFSSGEPPDTMGAVGPDTIVELLNDGYFIFDKTTGAQLFSSSDEAFWQAAGIDLPFPQDVFDHRIIYDPTVQRWFAVAITRGTNSGENDILVGVSLTSDPLDGFNAVQFDGDVDSALFVDYPTLGVDADGLYISTNNFDANGAFQNVSVFSIPKSNLLGGFPSLANLTRLENLDSATVGFTLQGVVDFSNPANGQGTLLSADYYSVPGGRLLTNGLSGVGGAGATLNAPVVVTGVPSFNIAPDATQVGGTVDSVGDRINSNVVQVGNSIWSAQTVAGGAGTAVRWFEIDATTNAVLQTGLIQDASLDFFMPSIAVNADGDVTIGMSGSSNAQPISSYAALATTSGGVTTFQTPALLQSGIGTYLGTRWGDYSATVVDPNDPNTFWTFQEISLGGFNYGTQVTEITFNDTIPISGNTTNDGIQINVRDNATLLNSTINNNIASANGANGIHVTLRDNATMNVLNIDGNTTSDNGANGILFETPAGTPTINNFLTVNGPGDASNNGASGINVQLNNVLGTPSVIIDGTVVNGQPGRTVNDNGATGINFVANNTPINFLVIANNTVDPNQGDGISAVFNNSQSNTVTISGNRSIQNFGDGINLEFVNSTSVNTINMLDNFSVGNDGEGIDIRATNTAIGAMNLIGNQIALSTDNGFNIVLDGAPVTSLTIEDNFSGLTAGNSSGFIDDSLPVIRGGFDSNVLAANDDLSTGLVSIGFDLNFFGEVFSDLFVNNNGNVTFDSPLGAFTPFPIVTNGIPMFAPFFADVDTQGAGQEVSYGNGTIAGRNAFGVNWVDVDYFTGDHPDQLNSFQLIFIDRSDVNPGDFDFEFNYGQILWETGDASGGTDGLGGSSARVGFTNGTTNSLEFAGSAVNGALLDSGPAGTSLIQNSLNSTNLGRYLFAARNGSIGQGGGPNGGDGIHIEQTNGSDIGTVTIDNNNISFNEQNGINFAVVDNSNIGPVVISNNTIDENTGDGIRLVNPNTTNNTLQFTLTDNTSISGNGGNGVNLEIGNGENLTLTMTGNTIGTTDLVNGGMGVRAIVNDNSTITANIGSTAAAANNFGGNTDAGFGLVMSDTATGSLNVVNSSFNNTVDGTDNNFAGVGLGVILQNNATLSQLHVGDAVAQNTNFNGNASHGLELRMSGTSTIGGQTQILNVQANENGGDGVQISLTDNATMPDLLVTGTATGSSMSDNTGNGFFLSTNSSALVTSVTMQDVTASVNTLNGLQFLRQGASRIINTTIDDATLTNNSGDGLDITAADNDIADTYTITDSTITGNTGNGVRLFNVGDADLVVSISDSTISENTLNGILATFNSDVTDSPTLQLSVTDSTINDNVQNGIQIITPHLAVIDNNTISSNTQDGINISGSSASLLFDQIINNDITDNGDDGIDLNGTVLFVNVDNNLISGNADDGVVMDSNSSGGRQVVFVNNNDILDNAGDGVQITARTASGTLANPNQYFVTNNLIADSGARGINVVNAGGTNGQGGTALQRTVTDLTISGNTISRSGLEAISVINTASNTQANADNVNNLASAALLADGSVFALPLLDLVIDNNAIDSSGQTQNVGNFIGSTGIIVRVGSSDATTSFTDAGGFANGGRGGVVAAVTSNTFAGNFGSDVTFHPFISTAPPATTSGTWTDQNTEPRVPGDDVFSVAAYVSDPLARLDLTFTNNVGNGLLATNTLAANAFYNNSEPEFKSRGITGVSSDTDADGAPNFPAVPDDNGPFNSGTRGRNAARQAARGGTFAAPTIAAGNTYLYPGVGTSTFRVQGGAAFANSGGAGGNVFTTTFSNFSTSVPIGGDVGELPFVWGSF